MTQLTQERLKELLHYDPKTGVFTWIVDRYRVRAGDEANSRHARGHIRIKIDGETYQAHRLAFFYMTGKWPEHEVDHKNLNRDDNRWEKLRDATRSQNAANRRLQSNNKSGARGVRWEARRQKWKAQATLGGKNKFLGYFETQFDAMTAYQLCAYEFHGEYARIEEQLHTLQITSELYPNILQ